MFLGGFTIVWYHTWIYYVWIIRLLKLANDMIEKYFQCAEEKKNMPNFDITSKNLSPTCLYNRVCLDFHKLFKHMILNKTWFLTLCRRFCKNLNKCCALSKHFDLFSQELPVFMFNVITIEVIQLVIKVIRPSQSLQFQ